MAPKRAATVSSCSDSEDEQRRKRIRSTSVASGWDEISKLKIYIVQAKIEHQDLLDLFQMIEGTKNAKGKARNSVQFELVSNYTDADVIISNIRMKKRLERHLKWDLARQKSIVTPAWLHQSIQNNRPAECGAFAAVRELHEETVENCPTDKTADSLGVDSPGVERHPCLPPEPKVKPTDARVFKNWAAKYACQRVSPLVCVNHALAMELNVLAKSREMEGLSMNALSYEKTVGMIKSYPHLITQETFDRDIKNLTGLGDKTHFKIQEFLDKGFIPESRETRLSERFQSLSLFTTIYGIGPVNARRLYDLGLRTIEDLERYYDLPARDPETGAFSAEIVAEEAVIRTPNGVRIPLEVAKTGKGRDRDKVLPDMSIKIGLMLRDELDVPIPREEIEEIHRVVMKELETLQRGCFSTIVGSYRRGKDQSNDVDIVIGHADLNSGAGKVKGLCKRFAQHLYAKGLVTQVMHLSSFHAPNALRTSHWDSLEKALTVFKLPAAGKAKNLHRRLDLIFAAPESYWTAVIGWSGSRLFERDLRSWAKAQKGLKFDSSGLTRRHDSRLFLPRSEQEVFDILGLDWIDPTMRNANV